MKEVVPAVVVENQDGCLSVDYGRLTPVLVEAMKELKGENDALRDRVAKIESLLTRITDH